MREQSEAIEGPGFEAMNPLRSGLGYQKHMGGSSTDIPVPPLVMRKLVGPIDPALFDNPSGSPIFPDLPMSAYEAVFDFGCGCGRIARQLLQQQPRPARYVGIDIHRGMIEWCQANLSSIDGSFVFQHHDVFNLGHGSDNTRQLTAPFEVESSAFGLVIAWSVFTHIYEQQAVHYLSEIARIMRPHGRFVSTWFLFDKREFPMMQDFQNTLFINETDPTNAVIYDREWLREAVAASGLAIVDVKPPQARGYHWRVTMAHEKPGIRSIAFPPDKAPYGSMPPPLFPTQSDGPPDESPRGETSIDENGLPTDANLGHPFVYPPDSSIGITSKSHDVRAHARR